MSRPSSVVLAIVSTFLAAWAWAQQPDATNKVVISKDPSGEFFWVSNTLQETVDKTGRRQGVSFAVGFNFQKAQVVPAAAVIVATQERAGENSQVQYRSTAMVLFTQCGVPGSEITNVGFFQGVDFGIGVVAVQLVEKPVIVAQDDDVFAKASKLACELHASRREKR